MDKSVGQARWSLAPIFATGVTFYSWRRSSFENVKVCAVSVPFLRRWGSFGGRTLKDKRGSYVARRGPNETRSGCHPKMAGAILPGETTANPAPATAGYTEISALRTIGNDWLRTHSKSWLKPPLSALNPQGHRDVWTSVLWSSLALAPGLEVGIMTQPRISASDCNALRGAFVKCVIEKNIPEDRWRDEAALLIRDFTDSDDVDSNLLEWIIRTGTI
ncbi:hypothetical protein FJV76_19175 [Mesorhizobium sp. WSM4303]|uniref:hypothetical protein n=1 Tax=unclassified Mesorhizobium TaxID=325217 RepID=UPI00115CECF6|nr:MULTISPECIES: hypothetical protein [unclassified Mesorhizobium]TRC93110.1 hypothetical protein FJV77_23085 [Mesorhizobium sp. WSM4306]TRD02366.1 hypothetical protein FJV76_19175 [Mesorhizobium sp. WSM4303]